MKKGILSKYFNLTKTALLLTLFVASHHLAQGVLLDSVYRRYQRCITNLNGSCEDLMEAVADGSVNGLSSKNTTLSNCCWFLKKVDTDVTYRDCGCIMEEVTKLEEFKEMSSEDKEEVENGIKLLRNKEVAEKCSIKPKATPNCSVIATAVEYVPEFYKSLISPPNFMNYDCSEKKISKIREICGFAESEARRSDTTRIDEDDVTASQCCIELSIASDTACLCVVNGKKEGLMKSTFSKESKDFVNFMTSNSKVLSLCKPVTSFYNFQDCRIADAKRPTKFVCKPPSCENLNGKTIP